ncbi:MAG TPA: hypothetical protein VNS32_20855 [Flavisolibacter sp.]|nr:hypothetical protein [Flavisolibacter sp.]
MKRLRLNENYGGEFSPDMQMVGIIAVVLMLLALLAKATPGLIQVLERLSLIAL